MSDKIDINREEVESGATAILSAAEYFLPRPLSPIDNRTTLTANEKCHSAFERSQNGISEFGEALSQSAENIKSVSGTFKEYDQMMKALIEDGYRNPVITKLR